MPDMVGAELDFVAFFRDAIRAGHDAGIIDQDVEAVILAGEGLGGGFDAFERSEIAFEEFNCGVGCFGECCVDFLDCCLGFALVTSCEIDSLWVVFGELMKRFAAQTDICTGN